MKWLDVGTTALPRLLTERSFGSFFKMANRDGYRLRWIFHLDVIPNRQWSEDNWQKNVDQAKRIAGKFDDAILMLPTTNQTYGKSCYRVFRETKNDVLWIEDDWLWKKPFRLSDVEAAARDGFNFHRGGVRTGATTPSLWKRKMVDFLLADYPIPHESATEVHFKRLLFHRAGFRNNGHRGAIPRGVVVDIGRECPFRGNWPEITTPEKRALARS